MEKYNLKLLWNPNTPETHHYKKVRKIIGNKDSNIIFIIF